MAKLTLTDLTNLSNETSVVNAINNNNAAIEAVIETILSRNGTTPNEMESNLDMNNFRILNLPEPVNDKEPLRKQDLGSLTTGGVSDHGLLTGLADDDHTQYHNDARGDARYYLKTQVREVLTAARTYYVRTDGSDSNNGLTDTAGGAFLTIQKAINTIASIDIGTNTVTIQVGAGTFGPASVTSPWIGSGDVNLVGNTGNPNSVTIAGGGGTAVTVSGGRLNVSGFNITAGGFGLYAAGNGTLTVTGTCHFGLCSGAHAFADDGAKLAINATYVINALGGVHIGASGGGRLQCNNRGSIPMAGGLNAASSFCSASRLGIVECYGTTFGAATTGIRYLVDSNAVIYTLGAGANLFPGSIGGVAQTGGQYL